MTSLVCHGGLKDKERWEDEDIKRRKEKRRRQNRGKKQDKQGGKGVSLVFRLAFIRFKGPPA